MTEQKMLGDQTGAESEQARVRTDEERAAMISAYLDGELAGKELEEFELLLRENPSLAREVQEMRDIESRLMQMGADILYEPVPEAMLQAISKFSRS